jgi:long-chain fatty acid transport protein
MEPLMRPRLAALAFALALWPAGRAVAGGFYVPEIGGRAVGMAGAMTAESADPSTIFHNPAGLTGLRGAQFQLGGDLVFPDVVHFRRPVRDPVTGNTIAFAPAENTNRLAGVPFAGASFEAGHGIVLGVAAFVPFGATLEFPPAGAQRFVVTSVSLRALYLGPAIAYRLTPRLSLGASVSYISAALDLRQHNALPFVTGDPETNPNPDPGVEGETAISTRDPFSLGATLGVQYGRREDPFTIGASLMLPTTLDLSGDVTVVNPAIMQIEAQPAGRRSDQVRLRIPLPLIARLGVMVRPIAPLALALDVNWQRWSTSRELRLDFAREPPLLLTPGATLFDVVMENRWRDTLSVRAAANVTPLEGLPLELRAGALYDQSPIDDRHYDLLTPDADKLGVSAGASYAVALGRSLLRLEVAFLRLFLRERDVTPSKAIDAQTGTPFPGTDRTILNKPAPSFFYGVTRARLTLLTLSATLQF